jgi:hypothetical protein
MIIHFRAVTDLKARASGQIRQIEEIGSRVLGITGKFGESVSLLLATAALLAHSAQFSQEQFCKLAIKAFEGASGLEVIIAGNIGNADNDTGLS